jgi:hypothetical protein
MQTDGKATVEKIMKVLAVDGRDARKAEWNNKEVSQRFPDLFFLI